jgi:hypothetical protein
LILQSVEQNERVVVCGWCKRVDVSGDWLEVELAVTRLGLFNLTRLPQITHGICVDCRKRVRRELPEEVKNGTT